MKKVRRVVHVFFAVPFIVVGFLYEFVVNSFKVGKMYFLDYIEKL